LSGTLSCLLSFVAVLGLALVAYSYVLYPVVLLFVAGWAQWLRDLRFVWRKQERRFGAVSSGALPPVGVVISAFNEEAHVMARVRNLQSLDYPPELLRFYIGSDGSTDRTAELLRAETDVRVHAVLFEANRGKASVLNDLVAQVREPIVLFSDANTMFDAQAVRRLVAHFSDPTVGGVCGELRLLSGEGDNQDGLYWRFEQMLKFFEARIGALLGANGAIYAIRRALWSPLAPDTICDDFCVAMNVVVKGSRLVYEPAALAYEDVPEQISDEYQRRVRIGIGNFQALFRQPEYALRTGGATAWAYVSHKVLRWIGPHLLVISLIASACLASQSVAWGYVAAAQAGLYATGLSLYALSQQRVGLPGPLRVAAFLFALNWAFMVASWRFVRGDFRGSWRRSAR